MSWLLWALPGLPAAAGLALLVAGRRGDRHADAAALAALAATTAIGIWAIVDRPDVDAAWIGDLGAGFAVDGLSAAMVALVLAVSVPVFWFSTGDIGADEPRARFFGFMLLFVAAMLATVTATSLGILLFAWELMGLSSWALIGFRWWEYDKPPSANRAFLITRSADAGLYLAVAAAVAGAGTFEIAELAERFDGGWIHVLAAGAVLSAAGKSAQLPLSSWLSAAMKAPSPVSALLHSATMVAAGAYLMFRLQPVLAETGWATEVIAWLGAATALALGLVALAQRELKELLAASTCAQIGFMFLAAGVGAIPAGVAFLFAHAAYKSLLFLSGGIYLIRRDTEELDELRGVGGGALKGVTATFAVGALALAALPPLSGWVAKDEVLAPAFKHGVGLWLVAVAAGFVTALYAGRALFAVLPLGAAGPPAQSQEPPSRRFLLPLALLAAAAAGWALIGVPGFNSAWDELIGGPTGPAPKLWELGLSAGLALLGLAVAGAWLLRGRLAPWRPALVPAPVQERLHRWLELDGAIQLAIVAPVLRASALLARFDERVVDARVRDAPRLPRALARRLRRLAEPVVDAAVEGSVRASRALASVSNAVDFGAVDRAVERIARWTGDLGSAARRPQTGAAHQYYAEAVVVLAVLLAVFAAVAI